MESKNDLLHCPVILRIFYIVELKMPMKWLRKDAENVQDWSDKKDEVNEVRKKFDESATWTIDGSENNFVPVKLINICIVKTLLY